MLIITSSSYSQNSIGIKNNLAWFKFSTESIENVENSYFAEDIQITKDYDFDIYFSQKINKIRWIYQIGYRNFKETRELNESIMGTLDISTRLRTLTRYRISLGIEKELQLKSLSIYYGIDVPFEYETKNRQILTTDVLDNTTNTIIGKLESTLYQPHAFRYGVNSNIKFYHFFHNIGIGIEFINGLSFHKPSKMLREEIKFYDVDGQTIQHNIQERQEKRLLISKISFAGIGIRYKLQKWPKKN
jgi:hypothetical protein